MIPHQTGIYVTKRHKPSVGLEGNIHDFPHGLRYILFRIGEYHQSRTINSQRIMQRDQLLFIGKQIPVSHGGGVGVRILIQMGMYIEIHDVPPFCISK
jgi:hypothetical protein